VTAPLGPGNTPFDVIGHDAAVALAHRFYDHMDEHEPALVAVHRNEGANEGKRKVSPEVRERFAMFLVEWLGGPQIYSSAHGHPRLRMRHAHVPIGVELRDAWLRCMNAALEHPSIHDDVRVFLARRFAEVADFLRNRADESR
jgi:hemoglobin